jgi:6-phosphogluconolactonase/glucosamine-6-phosphate isomerase/deaminase
MRILFFKEKNWDKKVSEFILKTHIKKLKKINLVLTGGRSAKKIYKFLIPFFLKLKTKINIFLSDERCVDISNSNLNFNIFTNFSEKNKINIFPIIINSSFISCAKKYSKISPSKPDLALLSLATDGHVASIFNREPILKKKKYIFVKKKFNGFKRITLTYHYLKECKKIIIICNNTKRVKALIKYMNKKTYIINNLLNLKKTSILMKEKGYKFFMRNKNI